MTQSLKEFATGSKRPRTCSVCVLPEAAEVNEALRDGIGPRVVWRWLTDVVGRDWITNRNLEYHKQERHHTQGE